MEYALYDAVIKDDIDVLKEMERRLSIHNQLTPTESTVLHLACQYGSIKCVEHILNLHKSLLLKINIRRETALHLAAREGHHEVIVALIDGAKSSILKPNKLCSLKTSLTGVQLTGVQSLIRTTNVENETALHLAVRYNHNNVVQLLVTEDPSHSHPRSKHGETPLYLASIRCNTDIIRTILDNCESPSFGGPHGRTALHAALLDDGGHDCVKLLLEKKTNLIQIADDGGWTAFHYAAYNDLYTIVDDLVGACKDVGYKSNLGENRTALHVAANEGNVRVMAKLVEYYPDSWDIVDKNGHNILHIAVRRDQKEVIRFILSQGCKASKILLIQGDKEGHTPLHFIAFLGCYVKELMDLRTVDWEVLNSQGRTPLDILTDKNLQTSTLADRVMVETTLINAKVKRQRLWNYRLGPIEVQVNEETKKNPVMQYIEKAINTHIIVAALITTVALTAGFAMPGGFDGTEGKNQGSAMLLKKPAFRTFIITDAVALLLSIMSLFLYFWTIVINFDIKLRQNMFLAATLLNLFSIMTMMLAFLAGTYAVLAHSLALALSVCFISSLFFFFFFYVIYKFIKISDV